MPSCRRPTRYLRTLGIRSAVKVRSGAGESAIWHHVAEALEAFAIFGADLELLPDRSFYSFQNKPFPIREVTGLVARIHE